MTGCGTAQVYSLELNMFIGLAWVVVGCEKSEHCNVNSKLGNDGKVRPISELR